MRERPALRQDKRFSSAAVLRAAMASAMSITLRAIFSDAASIILPSRLAAPLPCASAVRSSSMMRRALATSASGGLKTVLAMAIWLGWIAHLPSQPSAAARRAPAIYPSGSEKSPNGPSMARKP